MKALRLSLACALILPGIAAIASGLPLAFHDGPGNVNAMCIKGRPLDIIAYLSVPKKGWGQIADTSNMWAVKDVQTRVHGNTQDWTGTVYAGKAPFVYRQVAEEKSAQVLVSARITSGSDDELEGCYYVVTVPISLFAGGECRLMLDGIEQAAAKLPIDKPANPHLVYATGNGARISTPDSSTFLEIEYGRKSDELWIQDNRKWGEATYTLLFGFHKGSLPAAESASVKVSLRLAGDPDTAPVQLTLIPQSTRYSFAGCGGNFYYGVQSPQTRRNLSTLRVSWARHVMRLPQWEPQNDNDSPYSTDFNYLASHIRSGTDIEYDLRLMRELQARGMPLIATVWNLPKWLHPKPHTPLATAAWPETLECIGSYLLYMKQHYGVEPTYFSFNEPDQGVNVLFSAEGHRDAIRRVGEYFRLIGLKTSLLLGDTGTASGGTAYIQPAAADPKARQYVGAVAFHSWGGASPSDYAEWADVSESNSLPLIVTEIGSDAGAYMFPGYIESFGYAIDDLRNYMELFLHARPQGTLLWEYTSDYGLFKEAGSRLVPTARYWFVKHLSDLTPEGASALDSASSSTEVLFAAFKGGSGGADRLALHIANLGAACRATISGLPATVKELRPVKSGYRYGLKQQPAIRTDGGVAVINLDPLSLCTLTAVYQKAAPK